MRAANSERPAHIREPDCAGMMLGERSRNPRMDRYASYCEHGLVQIATHEKDCTVRCHGKGVGSLRDVIMYDVNMAMRK